MLSEIPLPTPLPHTVNNRSLLSSPEQIEQAESLLSSSDPELVAELLAALQQTSTDNM